MRSGLSVLLRKAVTITAASGIVAGGVIALAAAPAAAQTSAASSASSSSQVVADRPPNKPTGLTVNSAACTPAPIWAGPGFINLQATVGDPDAQSVTEDFQWWPAAHPDQRTDINPSQQQTQIDASKLTDQTVYAWRVRSSDGTETGPWSAVCTFKTDLGTPNAPVVNSTDYPPSSTEKFSGGSGIPGTFTFNANGSSDVVGFKYGMEDDPGTYVAANHPGGTATFQFAPGTSFFQTMTVESVTHSGTPSAPVNYTFLVANDLPSATCGPSTNYIDSPQQCTLTPAPGFAVSDYVYALNNTPSITVPAGPDGTATVTVTPVSQFGQDNFNVAAKLTNGDTTGVGTSYVHSNPAPPTAAWSASDVVGGTPVQVTFTATLPNSVSFTYTYPDGSQATVPADANGTATVTVTPVGPNPFYELQVYSTDANGVESGSGYTPVLNVTDPGN